MIMGPHERLLARTPVELSVAGAATQGDPLPDAAESESQDWSGDLRDRHAGTLGGRLASLDECRPCHVEIRLSQHSATSVAGQQLAIHLCNLLGRLEGVVGTVGVTLEEHEAVELLPNVDIRFPAGGGLLGDAVLRQATLAVPHRTQTADPQASRIDVCIGRGAGERTLFVSSAGPLAYIGETTGPDCRSGPLDAFGAHLAAALAAAAIFRRQRAAGRWARSAVPFAFDAWRWTSLPLADLQWMWAGTPIPGYPADGLRAPPTFTLVGAGAVGCAALLSLWAAGIPMPGVSIVDGDPVSPTNLNRYVLFGRDDVGLPKASLAAGMLQSDGWPSAANQWWSDYVRTINGPPELVLSAVDTNVVRHQIQDALPRVILGASTLGLRAEVGRYDLSAKGSRCLKCYNTPESTEADALLHRRLLAMDSDGLAREAAERGVEPGRLAEFVADLRSGGTGCALITGRELGRIRRTVGEAQFAVSFVSALAGTMLALQLVRESAGAPLLVPPQSRGVFQFWNVGAPSNTLHSSHAEPDCWCGTSIVQDTYRQTWMPP
jgi:hypothetical protein